MRLSLCLTSVLLLSCGQQQATQETQPGETPATAAAPAHDDGIQWFDGSVDEALSLARQQAKPVFLYWGASWCPPCNQIKSTIFVRDDFISKTRQFVPVYLDGDSKGAQRWGEHFGTAGYPTLIVLQPDGTELTRISSGMDAARYPQVLDLAIARNRPAKQRLHQALRTPETLEPDDWTLLSLYSWAADNGRTVARDALATTLLELAENCPETARQAKVRLKLLGLLSLIDAGEWLPDGSDQLLETVVRSPELSRENLTELQYMGADLLEASTDSGSERRQALEQALRDRMQQVFDDESLPVKQRLLTTRLLIDLANLHGRASSDDMQALARERAVWADEQATTPYVRQSMIYNAAWYLHEVGLSSEALQMYEAELKQAVAPHYYMTYLAEIEEQLGHNDKALDWSHKAWLASNGPATRTQWGSHYIHALLRLAPDDLQRIQTTITTVLDEMQSSQDGFYQRSLGRMQRLDSGLRRWANEDEDARLPVAQPLRERLGSMCRADQGETAEPCAEFS